MLSVIVAEFILEIFLEYLNSTRWTTNVPERLQGFFDVEKFQKQQNYEKETTRFGLVKSSIMFVITVVVIASGLIGWFDSLIRLYVTDELWVSVTFFASFAVLSMVFSLPFSIYSTFVIEEKFGFNKTNGKTFVLDMFKGLLLSALIGGPILIFVIWFYLNSGPWFVLYVFILITSVSLFFSMFYSNLIVPLFNKQTPLSEGELRDAIQKMCNKAGFKLKNIFVIDGSKRSSKSNAYFTGLGPKKRIVLYDTLIKDLTTSEIVAVLAHEIGHYKRRHIPVQMTISIASSALMLYILYLALGFPELSLALGGSVGSFHLGIAAFGILFTPISLITGLLSGMLSRKFEYQADNFAAKLDLANDLSNALKKLTVNNLSNPLPHPLYVLFHYSHPPVLERIKNLEK
ncbi:MAG: peptidase M48 [Bacteroidetes bacterium HGW-Bacteroidetes-21]|jgi:STE24 endopeptidase|nr:MAG: peptidase M48 [Bacteroidetes bacterium HGW-Bacteroidetes-21]